jgi:hypothetical protein
MKGITINDLAVMCRQQQQLGNGEKYVLISSDDECNEYHQAWSGLVDGREIAQYVEPYQIRSSNITDLSQVVVLT